VRGREEEEGESVLLPLSQIPVWANFYTQSILLFACSGEEENAKKEGGKPCLLFPSIPSLCISAYSVPLR
jgi:hypothetical protein